jgi:hypothetical protein
MNWPLSYKFIELAKANEKLPNLDGEVLKGNGSKLNDVARSHHYWLSKALVRYLVNPRAFASADLNSNHWTKAYIYNAEGFSYNTHVERSFWQLVATGYIRVTRKGFLDRETKKSGPTQYQLTSKGADWFESSLREINPNYGLIHYLVDPQNLTEIQAIRISDYKDGEKSYFGEHRKLISYSQDIRSHSLAINMAKINTSLKRCWIDLDLPTEEDWRELEKLMSERKRKDRPKFIDFTQKQLYRVFHDKEFRTGGRFYGGWWQTIPKHYRQHIIINGKPTIELDYSVLHPTILYAEKGIMLDRDAYSGLFDYDKYKFTPDKKSDISEKEQKLKSMRDLYKKLFNALVNSSKETERPPKRTKISHTGLKWVEIKERIYELHAPIRDQFCSGAGMRLMNHDSYLAEQVMTHFAVHGVPVLPVHDSFIMHHEYEEELLEVMKIYFKKRFDIDISASPKQLTKMKELKQSSHVFGATTTKDINALLLTDSLRQNLRTNAFWAVTQQNLRG